LRTTRFCDDVCDDDGTGVFPRGTTGGTYSWLGHKMPDELLEFDAWL
jgi:hypothetical protein